MDILALSVWMRYLEIAGTRWAFPPNAYQGDYVRDMAQRLHASTSTLYLHSAQAVLRGVPPAESDPEAHLDALIANAKNLLGTEYAVLHEFVLTEQLADCRGDLL